MGKRAEGLEVVTILFFWRGRRYKEREVKSKQGPSTLLFCPLLASCGPA